MSEAIELNPSIVVLRTGEKLITFLQEVFEGEGEERRGICLMMNYPYELDLISAPSQDSPELDLQVKFTKWCPYATDTQYRIPYDGILTIGEPDPGLGQAYRKKVETTIPTPTEVEPMPASGAEDSPNWQQQQQLVKQAIAEAGQPPAVTPEVV
jgi:hypothetical protein